MSDYSCYITIYNKSSVELTDVYYGSSFGSYESHPPSNISTGKMISFHLADKAGPNGATGWTKYNCGQGVIQFNYDCPFWQGAPNVLSFDNGSTTLKVHVYGNNNIDFKWSQSEDSWGPEGQYPSHGYPLSGLFVLLDI